MTGKLADTVMSVRNGEQIARKYQPVVFNPSTPKQIETRAKMKLLSQLSAVMAPVIAIARQGAVSSRNMFTKVNYPFTTYADNTADITLTSVQLTKSIVSLPNITAVREGNNVNVQLASSAALNRVVYLFFTKQADNTLRYIYSEVVNASGDLDTFQASAQFSGIPIIVYAYGVRDNSAAARVTFGNMQVVTAETVAKVITSRALLDTDVTLTETKGAEVPANRDGGNDSERKTTKK